jgi:cytoskeletal protein CcmA (bactofilin family)
MYIKGFLDISGGLTVRNHNFLLKGGDASMSGNLYVANTAVLQQAICLGDLSINGNIFAKFLPNTISPDAIIGGIPSTTGIFDMDVSLNRGLFVENNATVNGNISVGGKSLFKNDVSLNGNVYVDKLYVNGVALSNNYAQISGATFTGPVTIPSAMIQTLKISGDISANGNVFANGSLYENGNVLSNTYAKLVSPVFTGIPTAPTPDLSSSNTQIATTAFVQTQLTGYVTKQSAAFLASMTTPNITVTSDASFGGRIFVSGDSSLEGNVHVGEQILVDGNAVVHGGLLVQKDLSLNGNLSVQGNTSLNHALTVQDDVSFNGSLSSKVPKSSEGPVITLVPVSITNLHF